MAARNIVLDYPVTAGAASYWTIAWNAIIKYAGPNYKYQLPGHAGHFETAMMMALRPDLVNLQKLEGLDRSQELAVP